MRSHLGSLCSSELLHNSADQALEGSGVVDLTALWWIPHCPILSVISVNCKCVSSSTVRVVVYAFVIADNYLSLKDSAIVVYVLYCA